MKKLVYLILICMMTAMILPLSGCEKAKKPAFVVIEPADAPDNSKANVASMSFYMSKFDGEDQPVVENQGEMGACWAFAANAAMEYSLAKEGLYNFSEDHMIHNNGYGLDVKDGGDYIMTMAYLTAWKGPVAEEDDPYDDGQTNPSAEPVKHVQEIQLIKNKDYDEIKRMVYEYGAVESSIYIATTENNEMDLTYYNNSKCSYCYTDGLIPNHEIVIIGWDDEYSKDNFNTGAGKDGAFICLNSWGADFGNNGVFYVSYDDTVIGTMNEVYTKIENVDNYDYNYQYDTCGWIGRSGFGESHAYFANVYTSYSAQQVEAVGFYATEPNTSYKVYVCDNFRGPSSLNVKGRVYAEGEFENAGYYTVNLVEPVDIKSGRSFAVIVEVDTPGATHPIAVEIKSNDEKTANVSIDGKESYISSRGSDWERTQKTSACNVCQKVFTNDK